LSWLAQVSLGWGFRRHRPRADDFDRSWWRDLGAFGSVRSAFLAVEVVVFAQNTKGAEDPRGSPRSVRISCAAYPRPGTI
jgi:hypothetical protein